MGGNPLPVVIGALALDADELTLAHSIESREQAECVEAVMTERGVDVRLVCIGDGRSQLAVREALEEHASAQALLLYSGGTKAMSAAALALWAAPARSWVVRPGACATVQSDDGSRHAAESHITVEQILRLHEATITRCGLATGDREWLARQIERVGSRAGLEVDVVVDPVLKAGRAEYDTEVVLATIGCRLVVADYRRDGNFSRRKGGEGDGPKSGRKHVLALVGFAERLGGDEARALVAADWEPAETDKSQSPIEHRRRLEQLSAQSQRTELFDAEHLREWRDGAHGSLTRFVVGDDA